MLKRITLFFILLIPGIFLDSQDLLTESISSDTILSLSGSPYYTGQDFVIEEGATLYINEGVTLVIADGLTIKNNGRIVIRGTENNPVLFTTENSNERWMYIYNSASFFARHLIVKNAKRFINSYGDTVIIDHCQVSDTYGSVGDDCIGAHYAEKVMITNSRLIGNPDAGKTDAIDLDGISDDTIAGNTIYGFSDDGIDIGTGSKGIVIANNIITKCEMAISVGENSTAAVSGNLLIHSLAGIQSHKGSVVSATQNTLYGNIQGLRAYHADYEETSGGTILISNSIIANSTSEVVVVKDNSEVNTVYCLVDSILLEGEGNIMGDPGFVDPGSDDFQLSHGSIAIDAGDPDRDKDGLDYLYDPDDRDPDGTRLDIGCFPFYQSDIKIVEVSSSNLSVLKDEAGNYGDWIMLYNSSESPINLKGLYISDNALKPLKHQFKEDILIAGYDTVRLWADNQQSGGWNHLPFKLSGEGETLLLTDPDGNLMERVEIPLIPVNYFYRRIGLTNKWNYCIVTADKDTLKYSGMSGQPNFSPTGGAFSFPVEVWLSPDNHSDTIYYSSDGSVPDSGFFYNEPVTIDSPITLRVTSKQSGYVPSYTHARSYFAEDVYNLPVISLSAHEAELFGPNGIYTMYSKEGPLWERTVSFSYYGEDDFFSQIAGMRIQGGNSVWMPKKSFRLHFRGGYGNSRLNGTPFKEGPQSFKNLVLRAGYDDDISTYSGTMLRDPFSNELWKRTGELATESTFNVLLLNNNYWGIYNTRESVNNYFVEDKTGFKDFDLIRFQKWGADLKYGTFDEWNRLIHFFDTTDFTRPEVYDEAAAFMDMHSLLNLLSFVHCAQFRSWTWGAFAVKPAGGKWFWTIWDTDRSYNSLTWNGFLEYANTNAEKWPNFIPQKLVKNERFRNELINRNCDLLNTLFVPEGAISEYDSLVRILEPEMDAEFQRWNPGNRSRWDQNNERVREFLRSRPEHLYNQMKSYFSIDDTTTIKIHIVGSGKVRLNSIMIDQSSWSGTYMNGIPVELEAVPEQGANFIEWKGVSNSHKLVLDPGEWIEITAVFDTTSLSDRESIVINEIMYHPLKPESSEWIELFNPNSYSVSIEKFYLTDGGFGNRFEFPAGTVIDPESYLVVSGDNTSFVVEYGHQIQTSGSFNTVDSGFQLSNAGETIFLYDTDGGLEDYVHYSDKHPWPLLADGYGPSLQLKSDVLDNNDPKNWFTNFINYSTPGSMNLDETGIEAFDRSFNIKFYPNPVGEILLIELVSDKAQEFLIEIFTLSGVKVTEKRFTSFGETNIYEWQHGLTYPGTYIVSMSASADRHTKIVKLLMFTGN